MRRIPMANQVMKSKTEKKGLLQTQTLQHTSYSPASLTSPTHESYTLGILCLSLHSSLLSSIRLYHQASPHAGFQLGLANGRYPQEAMRGGVEVRRMRLEHLFPQPHSIRSQVDRGHVSLPKPWLLFYLLSWRCISVQVPPCFLLLWSQGKKWLLGLRLFLEARFFTIPSQFSVSCPNFCNKFLHSTFLN